MYDVGDMSLNSNHYITADESSFSSNNHSSTQHLYSSPQLPYNIDTHQPRQSPCNTATAISEAIHFLQSNRISCCSCPTSTWNTQALTPAATLSPATPHEHQFAVPDSHLPCAVDWSSHMSMGGPVTAQVPVQYRSRTPSASTIASNGPTSPHYASSAFPQVANPDYAPNSPFYHQDQTAFLGKQFDPNFANAGALYSPAYLAPPAHPQRAMQAFAVDQYNPSYTHHFTPSMSSRNGSPVTPQVGLNGDGAETKPYGIGNEFPNFPANLKRTESAAYQDELYNPPNTTYSTASSRATAGPNNAMSPHRKMIDERLRIANNARSNSPNSMAAVQRERSPFRDGSPLAPAGAWRSNAGMTAAGMRQQQKEMAERQEYAQHAPTLRREATKTISPKEAMLDYNGPEQPSLFQDSVPAGYQQHNGGTETWNNGFVGQPSNYGALQNTNQANNFSNTVGDGFTEADAFNFVSMPQGYEQNQVTAGNFPTNSYAAPKVNTYQADSNPPPFPATLTSMDSSMSDNTPLEESIVPRPADTRANTGSYSCHYHGCTQRFGSQTDLKKHTRDVHRANQHQRNLSATSSGASVASSTSRRSTESPDPSSEAGMTSAAIAARNSQTGPYKCEKINPSTNRACNTIFSRPYDLTRHEDTIHSNRKQKVRCHLCREEKTFSRTDALTRHMRVVHPEADSSFGKRGH